MRRVSEIVIPEDPLVAVAVHLVLIACVFDFQKIGLCGLIQVKLGGNTEVTSVVETQGLSCGPAANDCFRGITNQPDQLQRFTGRKDGQIEQFTGEFSECRKSVRPASANAGIEGADLG